MQSPRHRVFQVVGRAIGAAAILAGVSGVAQVQAQAQQGDPGSDDSASFTACIEALRRERSQYQPAGPQSPPLRSDTFETHVRTAVDMRATIRAASESQPEFKLPIWDYIARLVDAQRITEGQAVLRAQATPLQAIAARHGVDAATAVAVFGVETNYGQVEGRHRVVDATLSRACLNLKNDERKKNFFAALWLLQEGLVQPDSFRGSWAGAFGLTQFMPATFAAYMDNSSGSGKADIVTSVPDALATTANYLTGVGWKPSVRWGVEVTLPAGAVRELIGAEREHACLTSSKPLGKCRTVEQWAALGLAAIKVRGDETTSPSPFGLARGTVAALLAPAGVDGPAWLVTRNYQAIWQYNRADAYALAIGLLSDALRGNPPMRTAWPTDDPGLSRAQMKMLQENLIRRGHVDVVADGFDGPRTREAIRAEETRRGWSQTGRAGSKIAGALKESWSTDDDTNPRPRDLQVKEPGSLPR